MCHVRSDSELLTGEIEIQAALRHELIMVTGFGDHSFFQDDDRVGFANRAQTMRDHDCRPSRHQTAEIILDGALRFGVERAGCFIENQNRRVVVDGARDGDALFLSTGKRETGLTNFGFVTERQSHDEIVRRGSLRRRQDAIDVRFRIAERDVARDRFVKHVVFLQAPFRCAGEHRDS